MSSTVSIPGGSAELFSKSELTPRRRRPLEKLDVQISPLLTRIRVARTVTLTDGSTESTPGLPGPDLELTDRDADLLTKYQDAKVWARLKSWTLEAPLPASPDALLDVPGEVYDALAVAVAGLETEDAAAVNPFVPSEATLENPESPTGASAV
jgi:hypothetical protein